MNYFVVVVEDIDSADRAGSSRQSPSGYVTFLSLKNLSFYHIYRGGSAKSLTPHWRRGAPLQLFKELKFLKGATTGETRKIRREDFKKVFRHLNQIQKKSDTWCHIQVLSDEMTISHMNQEELNFQRIPLAKRKNLGKMCHDFIKIIQKDTLQGRNPHESIRIYRKKVLQQEPSLERLTRLSPQSYKIVFTGLSYKILSSITKIFFERPVMAIGLPNAYNGQIKTTPKIRKVVVLTNLAGNYLPHLNQRNPWWDSGPRGVVWKHIQGRFTPKRIEQFVEKEKIFQNYDLVIYRGHGRLKDKNISWTLQGGEYSICEQMTSRYIHLSCLNLGSLKDDLTELPFKEAILPLGFFPDRDETTLIKNIFKLIQANRSFRDACQEALWKNKEDQFFSYWFS